MRGNRVLWQEVSSNVYRFQDSCSVFAVKGVGGAILVNCGTGRAAECLDQIGVDAQSLTVMLTHALRDHCDGAHRFKQAGAVVLGNYWDAEYYLDPEQHFRERATWNSYDNRWDRYAPVRPIAIDDWLKDYETRSAGGLEWTIIPTPGPTYGASSLGVIVDGVRIVFSGEVLCGDGKVGRVAPLQYDYNDLSGAANVFHDAALILDYRPDLVLPSLGEIVASPEPAVSRLRKRIHAFGTIANEHFLHQLAEPDDEIGEAGEHLGYSTPRVFLSRNSAANTHFIAGKNGKILAIDYGYATSRLNCRPSTQHLSSRRPSLHSRAGLIRQFGTDRIDTVLVSHYHDDHVNGIPMLQRLYGTRVIAGENFADLLERPERYDRPCLWHETIRVDTRAPLGQTFAWDDVSITLYPMSGHTRFSTLICVEVDGVRFAHTGDQVFWSGSGGNHFVPGAHLYSNHVYKNGLDLGCYHETVEQLRSFSPKYLLSGHALPYATSPEFYTALERGARDFDDFHTAIMNLGAVDVHFGAECQAAKLKPYRAVSRGGSSLTFDGWVINPFSTPQTATLTLVVPDGWLSESIVMSMEPRQRVEFRIAATPSPGTRCRRQAIALDLTVGDRPFGQVTEALVTVGYSRF